MDRDAPLREDSAVENSSVAFNGTVTSIVLILTVESDISVAIQVSHAMVSFSDISVPCIGQSDGMLNESSV